MSTSPVDRCPVCDCDLSVRSPAGRCPDCGFEYNEQTRIWRSEESWARLAFTYMAYGLLVGACISLVYRASFDHAPYPMLPLVLGLVAPALGLLWRRMIGGRISARFVALTPPGIVVGTRPQPTLVPWDDFAQLTEQRGVLRLRRRSAPVLVPLDDIFDSPDELAVFRAAVSQAARDRRRSLTRSPDNLTDELSLPPE